jgi:hypothetical protein
MSEFECGRSRPWRRADGGGGGWGRGGRAVRGGDGLMGVVAAEPGVKVRVLVCRGSGGELW